MPGNPRDLRARVDNLLDESQSKAVPPAIQVRATKIDGPSSPSAILYEGLCGPRYEYFDVASLTKALVTVPLMMMLVERHVVSLSDSVSKHLRFLVGTQAGRVTIRDLLRHLSGLKWWKPYFETLLKVVPEDRGASLKRQFRSEEVTKVGKCVYSDLDFILLGWVIEEKFAMNLDEAAATFLFAPLGLKDSFFVRDEPTVAAEVKRYAPTLKSPARGLVQGIVFDDNAWSLGGVSGHAGLFSTLGDVHRLGETFLRSYLAASVPRASSQPTARKCPWQPSTMKLFASRAVTRSQGDWALGFALPTLPSTNAGGSISPEAFGHWAFTGPSLWIDPKRKTVVTILANRTFPQFKDEAKYKQFQQLRRAVHDGLWEMADARS